VEVEGHVEQNSSQPGGTWWEFAANGLYVCPSRPDDSGLGGVILGIEVAQAKFPENARMVAAIMNAILKGEAAILPAGAAVRLARFVVWDGTGVVATNARGQSTIIAKRTGLGEARELVDRLNAALDGAA
jgi:hypothetical protein